MLTVIRLCTVLRAFVRTRQEWVGGTSPLHGGLAETLSEQMCVSSTVHLLCTVLYSCTSPAQCHEFPDPASQAHHGTRHSQDNKTASTSIRLVRELTHAHLSLRGSQRPHPSSTVLNSAVQCGALVAPYEPHDGGSQQLFPIALPYPIECEAPQGSSLLVLRLFLAPLKVPRGGRLGQAGRCLDLGESLMISCRRALLGVFQESESDSSVWFLQ